MSAASPEIPHVSVVLRSYNRIPALCELIDLMLVQQRDDFEVIVIEQTTVPVSEEEQARLDELARAPRLRILKFPPLGGPGAFNAGARAARGEIIMYMDDDDLPLTDQWITQMLRGFEDPDCMAVNGRYLVSGGRPPSRLEVWLARRWVLGYMPLLKWQVAMTYGDRRRKVYSLHGGNIAVRRELLERTGLWDECASIEEELSFCYRFLQRRRPREYFLFDPKALMLRRFDVQGGMDRRYLPVMDHARKHFDFVHNIIAHYFPLRFVLLYPVYFVAVASATLGGTLWNPASVRSLPTKLLGSLGFLAVFPLMWVGWLARLAVDRLRHGPPVHDPRL